VNCHSPGSFQNHQFGGKSLYLTHTVLLKLCFRYFFQDGTDCTSCPYSWVTELGPGRCSQVHRTDWLLQHWGNLCSHFWIDQISLQFLRQWTRLVLGHWCLYCSMPRSISCFFNSLWRCQDQVCLYWIDRYTNYWTIYNPDLAENDPRLFLICSHCGYPNQKSVIQVAAKSRYK